MGSVTNLQEIRDALARVDANLDLPDVENEVLHKATGEGTSIGMEREQIADMVAASEARSETKLATAMGEVRTEFAALNAKISALPGRWSIFGAAFTVIAIILAALAFGNDMFSRGFDSQDIAQAAAAKAVADYAAAHPAKP